MNKILKILTFCLMLSTTTAYAKNYDALDVFEEYAVNSASLISKNISIETEKNQEIEGVFNFTATGKITAEIVSFPKHGTISLSKDNTSFTYKPSKNWVGTDTFQYKINQNTESSNISHCSITVIKNKSVPPTTSSEIGFVYDDMQSHWANDSAVKLVEADIMKGERIGSKYYFHPEIKMKRIDAIEYILAALKADFVDEDKSETHIFADSAELPEYINKSAFLAHKIGFLEGTKEGKNTYLRPYEYINRAEIIKMIDFAMNDKTENGSELTFVDAKNIPDWAVQSLKNLVGYGIVKGFEDKTLRPYDKITKAQMCEMICQMMNYSEENSSQTIATRIKHEFYGKLIV